MPKRHLLPTVVVCLTLFVVVSPPVSGQTMAPTVRVLVKIKSPLANSIESALPLPDLALLPGQSGNIQIETFVSRHSVRSLAPLYPQIVKLKKQTGLSDIEVANTVRQKFAQRASRLRAAFQPPEIARTYVIELDAALRDRLAEILNDLKADPNVEFAEEDKTVSANILPNDPYLSSSGTWGQPYDDLWGIKKIGAPAAWNTTTGTGEIVAVVDTGIDYNHPDIAANVWINKGEIPGNGIDDDNNGFIDDVRGWDFIGSTYTNPQQSNDPIDHMGHGTHVAGTIAAVGNNGIGVIGVAWNAQVMAVKGLDDQGVGIDSTLAPAILYAANNGADVISASWGSTEYSQTIADAISYAYNLGAVIVVAAGNNSGDARDFYPAALWNVITVAASDPNDNLASFSNSGSKIDVSAPGVDILSLQAAGTSLGTQVAPGYTRLSGTSMATPHVSGLAALILSQNANYSNEDVRQVLRTSATDLGAPGFDLSFGYGRINATAALGVTSVLEAKINSPVDGIVTQDNLTISGVARGTGFSHYVLEYGVGTLPTSWTTFQTSSVATSGTLGTLNAAALADGTYVVRLTAFNTSGQTFTDRIEVVVNIVFIQSPAVPSAPTSSTTFKNGTPIPIIGTATGASFQNFQVAWAPGLDPSSGWQTTGVTLTGGGLSPISSGLLANWDTSSIAGAGYYTIRLTVQGASTSQALTMVYFEPNLLSAYWPQFLPQGTYLSAGILPAINPDGTMRLVAEGPANGLGFGELWTLTQSGSPQQAVLPGLGSFQQPAVADLDGNPGEEAAVADSVGIEVVHGDNSIQSLASTTTLDYQRSQIMVEDLGGDSHWETLALGSNYNTQLAYISAWKADGTMLNQNFPIQIADQNPMNSWYNRTRLLVGDVDGDGKKEMVAQEGLSSATFTLRLFANDGSPRTWSVPVLNGLAEAMVAADLDHNGKLETILVSYSGAQAILNVFQPDGTERPGWPQTLPNPNQDSQSFLAVGDFNQDGNYEIVYSHEMFLYLFKANGALYSSAWPLQVASPGYASVVVGDIDGDGFPEIVTTLNTLSSTPDPFFKFGSAYYDEKLVAIRRDGTLAKSWQLTGRNGYDLYVYPAPAIGDFNQDGITDIAVAYEITGSPNSVPGVVTVVTTGATYNPAINDWPLIHHDPRNSNVLQSPGAYTSSSSTAVAASANPSVFGQPETFTAQVAPEPIVPGSNAPTGQVNLFDAGAALGSCTLSSATSNCTFVTSLLSVGGHAITASYTGDTHFTVSTSSDISLEVNRANSASSLVSSLNPSPSGQPVTLTATVVAVAPGSGTPTGTVTFDDAGASLGTASLLAGGQATLTITNFSPGTHSVTASYGGDANFAGSTTPAALSQNVNQAKSAPSLSSTTNPSVVGQAVTLTATVTAVAPGNGTPTGTVTFNDSGVGLGTTALNAAGQAALVVSNFTLGTHSLTATYGGDTDFAGGITSTVYSQIVNQAKSTSTLASTSNPSVVGQTVTFTARVSAVAPGAGTPTGTVTFNDAAVSLGTAPINASGQATLTTPSFTLGTHSVTASYGGDANFAGSTTLAALSQVVNQAKSATSLASSTNPSLVGQSVTLTATVSPIAPGSGTPTGTVTFDDGGVSLGTGPLNASGQATFTVGSFSSGTHSVNATYGGDPNFAGSSTPTDLSQVVVLSDFTLSASTAQTVSAGASVMYAITVAPNPSPFNYAVTNFSCTGLPAGAACSFSPSSVTPNTSSVTTILTIGTTSRTVVSASASSNSQRVLLAAWLSTGILGLCGIWAIPDKRQARAKKPWMALALFVASMGLGCVTANQGNSSNPAGTPAGSYKVTVQATANGNVTHTTTVGLTVN